MIRTAAIGDRIWQVFHLPRPVYWLSAAAFFASLATMAMKFLALFLATDLGYSVEAVGRVLMAYGPGAILGAFGGGTYLGAYHSIFSISQIVSPLIGTWIYSALGGHVLSLICGGLSIIAAAILWSFDLGRAATPRLTSLEKAQK